MNTTLDDTAKTFSLKAYIDPSTVTIHEMIERLPTINIAFREISRDDYLYDRGRYPVLDDEMLAINARWFREAAVAQHPQYVELDDAGLMRLTREGRRLSDTLDRLKCDKKNCRKPLLGSEWRRNLDRSLRQDKMPYRVLNSMTRDLSQSRVIDTLAATQTEYPYIAIASKQIAFETKRIGEWLERAAGFCTSECFTTTWDNRLRKGGVFTKAEQELIERRGLRPGLTRHGRIAYENDRGDIVTFSAAFIDAEVFTDQYADGQPVRTKISEWRTNPATIKKIDAFLSTGQDREQAAALAQRANAITETEQSRLDALQTALEGAIAETERERSTQIQRLRTAFANGDVATETDAHLALVRLNADKKAFREHLEAVAARQNGGPRKATPVWWALDLSDEERKSKEHLRLSEAFKEA